VLDEHRWSLGASELRAQATAHGAELAALAQRHAARTRQPRRLLTWSERWRATALAVPAARPPTGEGVDAGLGPVRQAAHRARGRVGWRKEGGKAYRAPQSNATSCVWKKQSGRRPCGPKVLQLQPGRPPYGPKVLQLPPAPLSISVRCSISLAPRS